MRVRPRTSTPLLPELPAHRPNLTPAVLGQVSAICVWCLVLPLATALLQPPLVSSVAVSSVAVQRPATLRPARRRCVAAGPFMAASKPPSKGVSKGELMDAIASKAGVSKKLASQVFSAGTCFLFACDPAAPLPDRAPCTRNRSFLARPVHAA